MAKRLVALLLTLLSACVMQTAHAFFDPPWITPAEPRAGEILSSNFRIGGCDELIPAPGYPQITREGNAIRIVEYGDRVLFGDCFNPIHAETHPIGALPPGDYTLIVDFFYLDTLFFEYRTITLGVIPFTVTGAVSTAPVPMFSLMGLLGLAFVLSSLALRVLWARHRDTF